GLRESHRPVAVGVLGILALALGLTPYLYTFAAPASAVSWGRIESLHELVALFVRQDYGGPGAFSPIPGDVDPARNLWALATSVGRAWLWLPALAGLALCAIKIRSPGTAESRAGWIALAMSLLLAGPLLVVRFD